MNLDETYIHMQAGEASVKSLRTGRCTEARCRKKMLVVDFHGIHNQDPMCTRCTSPVRIEE